MALRLEPSFMQKTNEVLIKARAAKASSKSLRMITTDKKNAVLLALATLLKDKHDDLMQANQIDLDAAQAAGQSKAFIDRLLLTSTRIDAIANSLIALAGVDDPIHRVIETYNRPNGLRIVKRRVPLGVIGMVYESRPNVTIDAFALAFKTNNCLILRGGKEALHTNLALVTCIHAVLTMFHIDTNCVALIENTDRSLVLDLLQARGLIDVLIPRGSAQLIQYVVENAKVPVLETGAGNCHIYIEKTADLQKSTAIVLNAKVQRPSVCNAVETLLVDAALLQTYVPSLIDALIQAGVEVRGCAKTCALDKRVNPAHEDDWSTEYLDLIVALKIVESTQEAIDHIDRYSTRHSEAILTEDRVAKECFFSQVDAAVVYHNASTRFSDGYEFGFEAEMGISTQKLHARGPMGLNELCTYVYEVSGAYTTRT